MRNLLLLSLVILPLLLSGRTFNLEADDDDGTAAPSASPEQATPAPEAAPQPPAEATPGGDTPAPTVVAAEEKKEEPCREGEAKKLHYVSITVKADMTRPLAQVNPGFGAHLEVRYILPWVNPWLTVGVDAGWYRLAGEGTQTDPQIGLYDYSWTIDVVPVNIGFALEIDKPLDWLVFIVGGGGSVAWARSTGDMFGGRSFAEDLAYGYYAHAGVEFRFLPFGGVTVEYRHSGFFLDFNYPELNDKVGDIGGAMVLVGYKYTF